MERLNSASGLLLRVKRKRHEQPLQTLLVEADEEPEAKRLRDMVSEIESLSLEKPEQGVPGKAVEEAEKNSYNKENLRLFRLVDSFAVGQPKNMITEARALARIRSLQRRSELNKAAGDIHTQQSREKAREKQIAAQKQQKFEELQKRRHASEEDVGGMDAGNMLRLSEELFQVLDVNPTLAKPSTSMPAQTPITPITSITSITTSSDTTDMSATTSAPSNLLCNGQLLVRRSVGDSSSGGSTNIVVEDSSEDDYVYDLYYVDEQTGVETDAKALEAVVKIGGYYFPTPQFMYEAESGDEEVDSDGDSQDSNKADHHTHDYADEPFSDEFNDGQEEEEDDDDEEDEENYFGDSSTKSRFNQPYEPSESWSEEGSDKENDEYGIIYGGASRSTGTRTVAAVNKSWAWTDESEEAEQFNSDEEEEEDADTMFR
eukprot:GILJ01005028.1.p1 GENE.GILJ01005028.1~~GILJ01005028.1.p1  ORF type:complete len:431 (-),score=90.75 GILJ01005028.1:1326-2618(-)